MKKLTEQLVVYQTKSGSLELRPDFDHKNIWATQADLARLYEKDQSVISRHLNSIFRDKEVDKKSNMQKMHIANSDKPVVFYSLDIILAVGYRTNSRKAIEFRGWVTKILKQYIVDGYVINRKRIADNYQQFLDAVDQVKKLLPAGSAIDTASVLELINAFADTWFSLGAYDQEKLRQKGSTKRRVALSAQELEDNLRELKDTLIQKKQATAIFAQPRSKDVLEGIIGNVMQSFGGKDVYASVEEKAAHLLYFMVKNHPFVDGNKRSGAYAFVWYLRRAKILDPNRITPPALTALTILVAESRPKDKDKMIGLIITLLS